MRSLWGSFLAAGLAFAALTGASCQSGSSASGKPPAQSIVLAVEEFAKVPYEKGELVLVGTPVPITLKSEATEEGFKLISLVQDIPYEQEVYAAGSGALKFAGTDAETFTPPIPLVSQPFEVPGTWTWAGEMALAGRTFNGSAEVESSKETLNLPGGPYDSVRLDVHLELEDKGGNISKRKLSFWLTDDHGIIKRDFAASSTRQPIGAKESES